MPGAMSVSMLIAEQSELARHTDALMPIIAEASAAVMEIYNNPGSTSIELKADTSPVTNADYAVHHIVTECLGRITPDIPVVSEEGDVAANQRNVQSSAFWVLDPLDGTKEFIKQNGQFTICIALVKNDKPVFGIVAAPALNEIYYGGLSIGSYVVRADGTAQELHVTTEPTGIIYGSISHPNSETSAYIAKHYPNALIKEYGSQLKFAMVASGSGDAYPRLNTTMRIWDVAAGHAIVEGAGGTVTRPDGTPISYKSPNYLAGDFVASR